MLSKLLILVVTSLILLRIHTSDAWFAKRGCQEMCGNVTIPYPFGIGTGCYLYKSFEVLCEGPSLNDGSLRFAHKHQFPILEFSIDSDLVRVTDKSTTGCAPVPSPFFGPPMILDKYFYFSKDRNLFVAVGCNISAIFMNQFTKFECKSSCNNKTSSLPPIGSVGSCTGFNGCCQISVPKNTTGYNFIINYNSITSRCADVIISENESLVFDQQFVGPVALNFVVALTTCYIASKTRDTLCGTKSYCIDSTVGLGYNCRCKQGYKGNPYLPNGCRKQAVINECPKQSNHYCEEGETCVYTNGSYKCIAKHPHKSYVSAILGIVIGLSALGAICYWTYIKLDRIRKNKMKKKLFIKNGGHLLKQHISANKLYVMTIKIHTADEMVKATENFSRSRFLGKGGQGTVFKGLFPDGTVVAIKKSNAVDAEQLARFVNEVFILAQINHRNIVKLLGCCLEYEVPLLVYEYLANDTLSQHLHEGGARGLTFSWNERIRIAKEVAGAVAYLHSYASPAIFHRDIKPGNILLDQNYKAVVSDFGLSKPVPLCRSHLTTQVEGTFGYLDPEYFQSGKLTAKSDVYSFGVVLTELLTRKKCISSSETGEGLVPRFKYLVKHNRLGEILDEQVVQEAFSDDVFFVAKLAKRCMKTNSKKRPSMEEVVSDLDKLRVVQLQVPQNALQRA